MACFAFFAAVAAFVVVPTIVADCLPDVGAVEEEDI
jgi:hypothetical protein